MKTTGPNFVQGLLGGLILSLLNGAGPASAQSSPQTAETEVIRIIGYEGSIEIRQAGAPTWVLTTSNQTLRASDRLRTGSNSRVWLRWSDSSVVNLGELSEVEILPQQGRDALSGLHMLKGLLSFFHRDKPGRIRVITRGAMAGIEGTEFVLAVDLFSDQERTTLSVIDGKVSLGNDQGTLVLTNSQQGVAEPGRAPVRTAGFNATNILQWCFYYPAVLDPGELGLNPDEERALQQSLAAYRAGDLLQALSRYPAERVPASRAEQIYRAGLLLAVGQVQKTEDALAAPKPARATNQTERLALALRTLIAAVKRQPNPSTLSPQLSTELLAASYYEQSLAQGDESLRAALDLARRATVKSPQFGFAWARVAELEFGFGHTGAALEALDQGLRLAPRNAQALALKGFLLAAENRPRQALDWFDQAIDVDPALGNAWLGRGLCRMRRGDSAGALEDLTMAAALEPQRALLRSYLGKAYAATGKDSLAAKEFKLATDLDPQDPTAWLYAALLKQQQGRVNQAIGDLEAAQARNDNRSLFRSRLLLDQDRAVSSANLASIYRDAGMVDVSVREATRAVNYDYGSYAAHLFLANSYNQLRDPQQINLRYETPWLSEYLLANLLAPAAAETLSQPVSQQEYSRLFERNRLGLADSTEYLSRGEWIQSGTQYGYFNNFGYAVDTLYISDNGQRPNNDQDQLTVSAQIKYDLTPKDSVYLQTIYYDASAGDLRQYYDRGNAHVDLRTKETQEPLLLAGYRHEWNPGAQTLLLAGRFDDTLSVGDSTQPVLLLGKGPTGDVIAVPTPALPTATMDYKSQLESYSVELQHIWQQEKQSLVVGARYQTGNFDTHSDLGASTPTQLASMTATSALSFATAPISQGIRTDFERVSGYGYYFLRPFAPLQLNAGLTYDYLQLPNNFRFPPVASGEDTESQVSPKAGFTWTPLSNTVARFAYTRSLGGVSFDQSVRLEPTQVAGFNQAFRSLIPESVAGSIAGAKFETFGLALEHKFPTRTYLTVEGQWLNSDVRQTIGAVDLNFPPPVYVASGTKQRLDYTEQDLIVTVNQLVGDWWSVGARYQLSHVELDTRYPEIPASVSSAHHTQNDATLNTLSLFALFNHRSGFFARAEGNWYSQSNDGYQPSLDGDDFWQLNLFAGYRFWRRHAQVQVGVLNVTDQDYQLNPLNLYPDLPRARTFYAGVQFNF